MVFNIIIVKYIFLVLLSQSLAVELFLGSLMDIDCSETNDNQYIWLKTYSLSHVGLKNG